MSKLVNIQVSTNNRDNNLFKFFIPSLKYLAPLNDICSVSMNYNGAITDKEIEIANSAIQDLGFELHYAKNSYCFEEGKHRILTIRNDCNKIDNLDTKYILIADDDLEFTAGYEDDLLRAIVFLEDHPEAGIVNFHQMSLPEKYKLKHFFPATPCYAFACYGGLLTRRIEAWHNLYPEDCLELYGGGEEQLQGAMILREGLEGYIMPCNNYLHEQHWGRTTISGQSEYKWDWDRRKVGTIMEKIASYESKPFYHDKLWTKEPFWQDDNKIYNYSKRDFEDELNILRKKVFE